MRRFALLSLALVGLASANKKAGIFNKMQRQMQADGEEEGRELREPLGEANGDFSVLYDTLTNPLSRDEERWMDMALSGTSGWVEEEEREEEEEEEEKGLGGWSAFTHLLHLLLYPTHPPTHPPQNLLQATSLASSGKACLGTRCTWTK